MGSGTSSSRKSRKGAYSVEPSAQCQSSEGPKEFSPRPAPPMRPPLCVTSAEPTQVPDGRNIVVHPSYHSLDSFRATTFSSQPQSFQDRFEIADSDEDGDIGEVRRQKMQNGEERDEEEENELGYSPRTMNSNAEMFAVTAMSLGMDQEDLLFNMMYFGEGAAGTFGNMFNTAMEETVALYSVDNTPYKLHPAEASGISKLEIIILEKQLKQDEIECAVCKDEMEIGAEIVTLTGCRHFFHADCIVRWLKLQAWCPVCREPFDKLESDDAVQTKEEQEDLARVLFKHCGEAAEETKSTEKDRELQEKQRCDRVSLSPRCEPRTGANP